MEFRQKGWNAIQCANGKRAQMRRNNQRAKSVVWLVIFEFGHNSKKSTEIMTHFQQIRIRTFTLSPMFTLYENI